MIGGGEDEDYHRFDWAYLFFNGQRDVGYGCRLLWQETKDKSTIVRGTYLMIKHGEGDVRMEIRFVNEKDDRLAISHIYEASWKAAYRGMIPQTFLDELPVGNWAGVIDKSDRKSLVLVEDDTFIGTASYAKSRWPEQAEWGEIISIYLLPEYIGKGYGKQLFQRVLEELKQMGFKKILLWVLEDNVRAKQFYEKFGFKQNQRFIDDEIGGKALKEVQYSLEMDEVREV